MVDWFGWMMANEFFGGLIIGKGLEWKFITRECGSFRKFIARKGMKILREFNRFEILWLE